MYFSISNPIWNNNLPQKTYINHYIAYRKWIAPAISTEFIFCSLIVAISPISHIYKKPPYAGEYSRFRSHNNQTTILPLIFVCVHGFSLFNIIFVPTISSKHLQICSQLSQFSFSTFQYLINKTICVLNGCISIHLYKLCIICMYWTLWDMLKFCLRLPHHYILEIRMFVCFLLYTIIHIYLVMCIRTYVYVYGRVIPEYT